jgi:hypothetical protein
MLLLINRNLKIITTLNTYAIQTLKLFENFWAQSLKTLQNLFNFFENIKISINDVIKYIFW